MKICYTHSYKKCSSHRLSMMTVSITSFFLWLLSLYPTLPRKLHFSSYSLEYVIIFSTPTQLHWTAFLPRSISRRQNIYQTISYHFLSWMIYKSLKSGRWHIFTFCPLMLVSRSFSELFSTFICISFIVFLHRLNCLFLNWVGLFKGNYSGNKWVLPATTRVWINYPRNWAIPVVRDLVHSCCSITWSCAIPLFSEYNRGLEEKLKCLRKPEV